MRGRSGFGIAVALTAILAAVPALGTSGAPTRLRAGVGVSDITPDLGRNFNGYVRPEIFAAGVALRLQARALVLERGTQKLALVSVDLMGAAGEIQRGVAARVADLGFTDRTILLAGSHTHAGPDFTLNPIGTAHPAADLIAFLVEQISEAVRLAHSRLRPAALGWSSVEVPEGNDNRSLEGHLADHGLDLAPHTARPDADPLGLGHTVDRTMHLLRVDAVGARGRRTPLAAWFRFSAHDTAFPPSNDLYASDWSGIAQWRFERGLAAGGHPGVIAMFANGNEGDLVSRNDSYNPYATADSEARKVARAMRIAWGQAESKLTREPALDVRTAIVCFCGQQVSGGRVASQPFFGISFLGGAENGPSIFYQPGQLEGRRRPAPLADPVHGRKITVAPVPFPTTMALTQARIGDALIATVPGEPTVEVGRRIASAMRSSGARSSRGIARIVVVGLAQEYSGYFTTPEEYDQQHYEGGSTVHGKWSSNLLVEAHADLTRRLLVSGEGDPPPQGELPAANLAAAPVLTGDGGEAGAILEEPPAVVERMSVVGLRWTGGRGGNDRPLDAPFIMLERSLRGGWVTVSDDLGVGFVWRFGDGAYSATYDVPPELPPGTYRLTVQSARYTLRSRSFDVVPSRRLIVRGVTARVERDGRHTVFSFFAAMPAPDPALNLWDRDRIPTGGRIVFRLQPAGHVFKAVFDPASQSWVARLRGAFTDVDVLVGDGGLVDAWGNTSSAGRAFTPGRIDPVSWPPVMPVGGWCVPGAFGRGCSYPQGLFSWPPGPGR